eukprot:gene24359-29221_t
MVVVDGNLVTAGAAFAHIDLALSLVRSISPDLAQHVAKLLIIDERPSQAAFVAYEHLRHEDPIVVEFERFVRARLDEPFNVAFIALRVGYANAETLRSLLPGVLVLDWNHLSARRVDAPASPLDDPLDTPAAQAM